jgi:hypothetical protein
MRGDESADRSRQDRVGGIALPRSTSRRGFEDVVVGAGRRASGSARNASRSARVAPPGRCRGGAGRCRPAHGDEVGGDGAGRAVLGVRVLLEVAEERVGPRGSMNREVKQGKRSPSGTQSLERVPRQRTDQRFAWIAP